MVKSFREWLKIKKESFGGSALYPSSAEEHGDGGEQLARRLEKPGAFPTYELPNKKKMKKKEPSSRR